MNKERYLEDAENILRELYSGAKFTVSVSIPYGHDPASGRLEYNDIAIPVERGIVITALDLKINQYLRELALELRQKADRLERSG